MSTTAMPRVEVFADIVCPFTHVGLRRFVEARSARPSAVRLRVRAWPLEWVNGRPLSPDTAAREIDALRELVAPDLFAGFDPTRFPASSVPAFGLVAAAYLINDPTGEAVSLAVRDALFERGLDVTDPEVLRAVGDPYGVVPMEAAAAEAATRVDWERGKAKGVQGSPHFFVGDADWFCPSLVIRHEGDAFDIKMAPGTMQQFYEATLG